MCDVSRCTDGTDFYSIVRHDDGETTLRKLCTEHQDLLEGLIANGMSTVKLVVKTDMNGAIAEMKIPS